MALIPALLAYTFLIPLLALLLGPALAVSSKSKRMPFAMTNAALTVLIIGSLYVLWSSTSILLLGYFAISPFSAFFLLLFSSALMLIGILAYHSSDSYAEISFLMALSFIAMFAISTAQSLLSIFVS